jgi:hypothetical protein
MQSPNATLGQAPNTLNELIKLYAALTGERPAFVDIDDAAREFKLKLEDKHVLIVLDDVWHSAHARPFLAASTGCAQLITTRVFEVAADAERIDLDRMTSRGNRIGSLWSSRLRCFGRALD